MSEHTPTPWHLDGEGVRSLVRGDDFTIVAVRHRLPGNVHEANAAFIVEACNNHDRLTRENNAMRESLETIASRVTWEGGRYVPTYEAEVASAALASLKEPT